MHPFDIRIRLGRDGSPDGTPFPGVHSAPRSPADPDTTPKPSLASPAPSWLPPRAARDDGYNPANVDPLDDLEAATARYRDPLAAARSLYAPELLETNE